MEVLDRTVLLGRIGLEAQAEQNGKNCSDAKQDNNKSADAHGWTR